MKRIIELVAIALVATGLYGCKDVHLHPEGGEHEIITTVTLTFVDQSDSSNTITAVWEDVDGIGGANPNRIDTIKLSKAKTYRCYVTLQNHSAHPALDVTGDIKAELDNHQLFYDVTGGAAQISITDADSRGLPIGLQFNLMTSMDASAVPGSLTMSLYHYDNSADKTGSNRGNETDIEVTLPLLVR
ncbi:MAG: hypothetical protein ACK5BQ_02550 [Ignavibacteria bacterium]|jgi:hypothetical protein